MQWVVGEKTRCRLAYFVEVGTHVGGKLLQGFVGLVHGREGRFANGWIERLEIRTAGYKLGFDRQ